MQIIHIFIYQIRLNNLVYYKQKIQEDVMTKLESKFN